MALLKVYYTIHNSRCRLASPVSHTLHYPIWHHKLENCQAGVGKLMKIEFGLNSYVRAARPTHANRH